MYSAAQRWLVCVCGFANWCSLKSPAHVCQWRHTFREGPRGLPSSCASAACAGVHVLLHCSCWCPVEGCAARAFLCVCSRWLCMQANLCRLCRQCDVHVLSMRLVLAQCV